MPTTRASPIIRAVAVAAVRAGFERAESAASRPSTGARRRTGHESTRVRGEIRNGATSAIPKKIAIVPAIPAAITGVVVSSAAPSRNAPARPGAISRAPASARAGRGRVRTPSEPSTARIGAIRPARRAGLSAPSRAVTSPVATAAAKAIQVRRRSPTGKPTSRISAIRATASASPSPRPRGAPTSPIAPASSRTERTIIGRVAPRVRCIPISRMRWSTVMLKLLKIRKPPTNSAMPAKK